jgi:hypothetical protein
MRRLPAAFVIAAAFLAFGVGLAAAKVPYFSVEVTPQAPTAGEPVTVVVRLWNDPAHIIPAAWAPPQEVMDEMVAFLSEDQRIDVDLTRAEDRSYRGTATLPAGSWTMVPFPEGARMRKPVPGYQTPIALTVSAASPPMLPLVVGAAAAAIAAVAVVFGRRRRSHHRKQEIRQHPPCPPRRPRLRCCAGSTFQGPSHPLRAT